MFDLDVAFFGSAKNFDSRGYSRPVDCCPDSHRAAGDLYIDSCILSPFLVPSLALYSLVDVANLE